MVLVVFLHPPAPVDAHHGADQQTGDVVVERFAEDLLVPQVVAQEAEMDEGKGQKRGVQQVQVPVIGAGQQRDAGG